MATEPITIEVSDSAGTVLASIEITTDTTETINLSATATSP